MPATLTKLEQAVKRAHSAHAKAAQAHHAEQKAARQRREQPTGETASDGGVSAHDAVVDDDLDDLDAEAV